MRGPYEKYDVEAKIQVVLLKVIGDFNPQLNAGKLLLLKLKYPDRYRLPNSGFLPNLYYI